MKYYDAATMSREKGFSAIGNGGNWWSKDITYSNRAYFLGISSSDSKNIVFFNAFDKGYGFSVRCIKD